MRNPRQLRIAAFAAAVATAAGLLGAAAPAEAKTSYDTTSATERQRVDTVPTPRLDWFACSAGVSCATVKLPVDYDRPRGPQTEIALLKDPADDPSHKIGTLFVNPGGPGGSGTTLALLAATLLSPDVLARFDVVGFDPRGTNLSDQLQCFPSLREQVRALDTYDGFPTTRKAQTGTFAASRALGKGCATTGEPLAGSMSTAQVARDLDVLRRAVGDTRLSYLGFSYGTYLGQVYANLFPDRVRALALDGVVDPLAWRGSAKNHNRPQWDRLRSADGATRALHEILLRCDRAPGRCPFAVGDPVANFDLIARRLKKTPIAAEDLFGDRVSYGYPDLIGEVLGYLYSEDGADNIVKTLADLLLLTEPPAPATRRGTAAGTESVAARRTAAREAALDDLVQVRRRAADQAQSMEQRPLGFPYDDELETFTAVSCTDSLNPDHITNYPSYAATADRRAKYFGALFVWNGQSCAKDVWKAKDEDAYRGAFNHRTVKPLLFVGNTYDPATNYRSAVRAARLAPNNALLSSNSWGHTAYGTSTCATGAIDKYLLTGKTPVAGKTCTGDYQPFAAANAAASVETQATTVQKLTAQSRRKLQELGRH